MGKTIVFTGGGSAGHVTANLALIPAFIRMEWNVIYIGSRSGIEADLIKKLGNIRYFSISTGKWRRYFSMENFIDPFRVIHGIIQSYKIIRKSKPGVVFSRGGFVAVPVILGAWLNQVPVIIHESNITPGLANKISAPFAKKICLTFSETEKYVKSKKNVLTGPIIREELKNGKAEKALELCGFSRLKPIILVMGGSLGARRINEIVRKNICTILTDYQVVHICGKGGMDNSCRLEGYKQFEFLQEELADLLAIADLVISRSGANSICEFLSLRIPMLLIPLSIKVSRGDQILNAEAFKKKGYAEILHEDILTDSNILRSIALVSSRRGQMIENMRLDDNNGSIASIINLIRNTAR